MGNTSEIHQSQVTKPAHVVSRRYHEPIIYLAERMASMDKITPAPEARMVDKLAHAVGIESSKKQRWFRDLNDDKACEKIDTDTVKRCVLVVLTLVLKADTQRGEEAKKYFSKIRELLDADPITVPVEMDEHQALAMKYLKS